MFGPPFFQLTYSTTNITLCLDLHFSNLHTVQQISHCVWTSIFPTYIQYNKYHIVFGPPFFQLTYSTTNITLCLDLHFALCLDLHFSNLHTVQQISHCVWTSIFPTYIQYNKYHIVFGPPFFQLTYSKKNITLCLDLHFSIFFTVQKLSHCVKSSILQFIYNTKKYHIVIHCV